MAPGDVVVLRPGEVVTCAACDKVRVGSAVRKVTAYRDQNGRLVCNAFCAATLRLIDAADDDARGEYEAALGEGL